MNEATQEFIRQHREDDVRQLALKGKGKGEVDLPLALQQIAGWQTARRKLPSWAACDGLLYPPHLNMEQCSSEQTARYKAGLAGEGDCFVDLTGGLGVDFYFMSKGFKQRIYVEQQELLCDTARHNFALLGHDCSVVCGLAADVLSQLDHASVIYLDPARRDQHGARTYSIQDCTPNVLELRDLLLQKADRIILKLSPMLDWHKAVEDLGNVSEVHIVSVQNECKELLLVLQREQSGPLRLVCVNDNSVFEPSPTVGLLEGKEDTVAFSYLYEPNASIMKAGCFDEVADFYHVCELSANSHLFTSDYEITDFPGRGFRVEAVSSMNKRELKTVLQEVDRANITVRNFPMSVAELRKRLHLKEGGDVYIFATTVHSPRQWPQPQRPAGPRGYHPPPP